MIKPKRLTAERARDLLSYDAETGVFSWRVNKGSRARAGDEILRTNGRGYREIYIDGEPIQQHRLAWLYVNGEWPSGYIDHINGDIIDNRIINLRVASQVQNGGNQKIAKNNTSGFKGVHFNKARRKWVASIRFNGKLKQLGSFLKAEDAARAYDVAAVTLFGQFARTNEYRS